MATAIAASYMHIPLVHIQGGEITGSIDEKVRHAVTKLADLHMVASPNASERVIRMGERPDRVFMTGCPSIDVARRAIEGVSLDFDQLFEASRKPSGPYLEDANGLRILQSTKDQLGLFVALNGLAPQRQRCGNPYVHDRHDHHQDDEVVTRASLRTRRPPAPVLRPGAYHSL